MWGLSWRRKILVHPSRIAKSHSWSGWVLRVIDWLPILHARLLTTIGHARLLVGVGLIWLLISVGSCWLRVLNDFWIFEMVIVVMVFCVRSSPATLVVDHEGKHDEKRKKAVPPVTVIIECSSFSGDKLFLLGQSGSLHTQSSNGRQDKMHHLSSI